MTTRTAALMIVVLAGGCGGGTTGPRDAENAAPGPETSTRTAALETAANLIQDKGPVEKIALYLNGFHVAKADPAMQMEAHHYCNQVTESFAQCVLFDGDTDAARLMGIEYIIAEALYDGLPAQEKAYWHPHNYEILSGQLHMPGVPDAAEKAALEDKINSYGKTWHTWMAGMHGREADELPFGPPQLQWSFNHDGEAIPAMVDARDQRLRLDSAAARRNRQDLTPLARPQGGVDAMAGRFSGRQTPIPGVQDRGVADAALLPFFELRARPASGR